MWVLKILYNNVRISQQKKILLKFIYIYIGLY